MTSPLDKNDLYGITENNNFYSFTINVSPNKYVYGRQWDSYPTDKQEKIIKSILDKIIYELDLPRYDHYFETTKIGFKHLHGCIFTCELGMLMLQRSIHDFLGIPKLRPSIVFFYEQTKTNVKRWYSYMHKTDPAYHGNSPKSPGEDIDFVD